MKFDRLNIAILAVFALALALAFGWNAGGLTFSRPSLDFAAEYGNIAENLVAGNGFSGPFEESTRSSSWMPPLLPMAIAGVFLLFGSKTVLAGQVLMGFQLLAVWCSLAVLLQAAQVAKLPRLPLAGLFGFYTWLNSALLFGVLHDTGLVMLGACLALLALLLYAQERPQLAAVTAFLLPLVSPTLTLAFLGVLLTLKPRGRTVLLVLGCTALSLSCWTIRNAASLRAFVPIKSNLWFDFHMANVLDPDGVVGSSTFDRFHPIGRWPDSANQYRSEGEIAFNRSRRQQSMEFLQVNPGHYLSKLGRRLFNATVLLQPVYDIEDCHLQVEAETQAKLMKRRLVRGDPQGMAWCSLDLERASFEGELRGLTSADKERLTADWLRAQESWSQRRAKRRLWALAHALLPTLALVWGLTQVHLRDDLAFRTGVGLYLLYLLPYVLVSHYSRYQIPLMGLAVWLVMLSFRRAAKNFAASS